MRIRESGTYAQVRGTWFRAWEPSFGSERFLLLPTTEQRTDLRWIEGLWRKDRRTGDGWYAPSSIVDTFISVENRCDFAGGGPFRLDNIREIRTNTPVDGWIDPSLPGYTVVLDYAGDDREWASALPGFETFSPFHAMSNAIMRTAVPLNETTAHREVITEFPTR